MLSARRAAQRLGFATSNPILDAIRNDELPAQRSESRSRNGVNNASYRIREADLLKWAAARGIELSDGTIVHMPEPIAEAEAPAPLVIEPGVEVPEQDGAAADTYNVIGLVPRPSAPASGLPSPAAQLGFVTIPIEHYAALVADRAELEFTKRHFELRFKRDSLP